MNQAAFHWSRRILCRGIWWANSETAFSRSRWFWAVRIFYGVVLLSWRGHRPYWICL